MTNQKAAQVLLDAAAHIEKVGLFKGDYFREFGNAEESPCCTLGAIHYVTGSSIGDTGHPDFRAATNVLIESLRRDHTWATVQEWNDKPTQRKGRVVAKLRKVAKELEGVQ